MLADQFGHLVVDALDRAGGNLAVGVLDEGGRRVDHPRRDARRSRPTTSSASWLWRLRVDLLPGRPRCGRDVGEVGQRPGRTHVVIMKVDDLQRSRALRGRFRCRRERTRSRNAGAECTEKLPP